MKTNTSVWLGLLCLLGMQNQAIANDAAMDTANAIYTGIDPARVSTARMGSVTHGYHPDVMTYYRSEVSRDKEGKLHAEGSNYIGDPDFDWEPTNGFYAFCKDDQINLGISYIAQDWGDNPIDFWNSYTNLLFKLDNNQRFYTEAETFPKKRIKDFIGGLDTIYFRPTKAMITALKEAKAGSVKIDSTGKLNQIEEKQETPLIMNGFGEMLTRVMNHCPVTADEVDLSTLSERDRLTLEGERLLDIELYNDAIKLLTKAAEMGDAKAGYLLGEHYESDYKRECHQALSDKYYQMSVDLGYPNAQCAVAVNYLNQNDSAPKIGAKAKALLEKAEAQGAQCASYNLGYMYLRGLTVKKDVEKARTYLKVIAENNPDALLLLLETYRYESKNLDREAYYWIQLKQKQYHSSCDFEYNICKRSPEVCQE